MKRQNSHTIAWKCQTGVLPRTPGLQTLPWTPGQNTLGRHADMLAEVSLVDEEQAHARMVVILGSIDADWLRRTLNRHKMRLHMREHLHDRQHRRPGEVVLQEERIGAIHTFSGEKGNIVYLVIHELAKRFGPLERRQVLRQWYRVMI